MRPAERKPEVFVFAGPNGSGKSTLTGMTDVLGDYINADDIQRVLFCDNLTAAQQAEKQRKACIAAKKDFTFETVLSTDRNLDLLKSAKESGYFIRCCYVITSNPAINISRVTSRVEDGGHGVPEDKIISRYYKSRSLLPEFVKVCDIINIYDNTLEPTRIFSKKKDFFRLWENEYWSADQIVSLTGIVNFDEKHLRGSFGGPQ